MNTNEKNISNSIFQNIILNQLNQGYPENENQPKDRNRPGPYDREDLYKEYEIILYRLKGTQQHYDSEYLKLIENENQIKHDKIYLCLLIIIACILAIIIIIFSCYELYKYRKKKKLKDNEYSISKLKSFGKEFKSSFESSKSTNESNKKNSQSDDIDIYNSSNFNILNKSKIDKKIEDDKKEEEKEIIIDPYNNEDEAPIQFYKNNNSINDNNNINNFNDDMKTLTNDEDIYFASKTDKLLYKPYSNEEINNKK